MFRNPVIKIAKKACPAVITIVASKDLPKIDTALFLSIREDLELNHKGQAKIGGGSGFLVSSDGYILTCSHVVKDLDAEYSVLLSPEKKYSAKVLSRDPLSDIAVLKIRGSRFPHLKLGNSDKVELGEQILAIGNPLGEFEDTLSCGIISGLSRRIRALTGNSETSLRGLFQTDAAINPGNSGGPIVNTKGEAIGINTAMIMGAENIGFAIPINYAKDDLREVKKYGKIKKPFLGIKYINLNKEISKSNSLPVDFGALIVRERFGEMAIARGSAAEEAGLKEYDIIVAINNKKIDEHSSLADIMERYSIGDKIKLKILRKGKETVKELKLKEKK